MGAELPKLNKTRICISCKKRNPSLRKIGMGTMMQIKCLECGKDAGFVFEVDKKK